MIEAIKNRRSVRKYKNEPSRGKHSCRESRKDQGKVSVAKGLDVDKPRNLAKSVTVE